MVDPSKDPAVYLTALPNGVLRRADGDKLQLTLLFTPSLPTPPPTTALAQGATPPPKNPYEGSRFSMWLDDPRHPPFASLKGWAISVSALDASGVATPLTLTDPTNPNNHNFIPTATPVNVSELDSVMWHTIFDPASMSSNLRARGRSTPKDHWHVSHDAATNSAVLDTQRLQHFRGQYFESTHPELAVPSAETAEQSNQTLDLYLRATLQTDTAASMAAKIQRRKDALAYLQWLTPANDDTTKIQKRITRALAILEPPGEQLCEVGIYALYCHCASSVLRKAPNPNADIISGYLDKITAQAAAATGTADMTAVIQQCQHFIEFLLFSRRKRAPPMAPCQTQPLTPPDFHQTLGFISRYPTLLRPLGLAVDLEIDTGLTSQFPATGTLTLLPLDPKADDSQMTVSFQTAFDRTGGDFIPLSHYDYSKLLAPKSPAPDGDKLLKGRFLWLQAQSELVDGNNNCKDLFTITSNDTEGSLHKRIASSEASGRGDELAPTPDSNAKLARKAPPSERSLGLTLLHSGRADRLSSALANPVQDDSGSLKLLCADDLTLGYRIDAKRDSDAHWFSLCDRNSIYSILAATPYDWSPTTDPERMADEGFVTLGATTDPANSSDAADINDPKLRFHQALMTWTGWNLSVLAHFDPFNSNPPQPPDDSNRMFHVNATHTITGPGTQLPLRFDCNYTLRCRVVDLAGNSVRKTAAVQPTEAIRSYKMRRHEPIRPPHILLDRPIIRAESPGDHIDHVILRDNGDPIERVLVPPRETLRVAELHNMLRKGQPPDSAFPRAILLEDGTFPTVRYAYDQGWFEVPDSVDMPDATKTAPPELQDPIFRHKKGLLGAPTCGFYPDPLARYVRVCVTDATKGTPVPMGVFWLDHFPYDKHKDEPYPNRNPLNDSFKWPQATPCRIRIVRAEKGQSLSAKRITLQFCPNNDDERPIQGLEIVLPKATTLRLDLSSATKDHDPLPSNVPSIATSTRVALFHLHNDDVAAAENNAISVSYPRNLLQPAVPRGTVTPQGTNVPGRPALVTPLYPSNTTLYPADIPLPNVQSIGFSSRFPPIEHPEDLLDGSVGVISPTHRMTVVHAVRKPLADPGFVKLDVQRTVGQTVGAASGAISADWISTSSVACNASWTDLIDDVTKPCPESISYREVAFSVAQKDVDPVTGAMLNKAHLFRDTRAHYVSYEGIATSKFKSLYRSAKPEDFDRIGAKTPVTVLNSVRPPAPVISYIIPAFQWQDNLDKDGAIQRIRVTVLRLYLERPFCITGNDEGVGILIALPSQDQWTRRFVSRIGLDPTRQPSEAVLPASEVTQQMLPVDSKQVTTAYLAEASASPSPAGRVGVITYPVSYSKERQLWFCDVPFLPVTETTDTSRATIKNGVDCPFVRLSLVRWQPDSIKGVSSGDDTSISPVVMADFIQVASNRWCSVQQVGKKVTITLSGVSSIPRNAVPDPTCPNAKPAYDSQFSLELQHRWHSVDEEVSWRPVTLSCNVVTYSAPISHPNGIISRMATITLPHSSALFKYRILIKEKEFNHVDDASSMNASSAPSPRTTYFDFVEL